MWVQLDACLGYAHIKLTNHATIYVTSEMIGNANCSGQSPRTAGNETKYIQTHPYKGK